MANGNLGFSGSYNMYMGYLWPFVVYGRLGSFGTLLKMACNWKTAGRRAKQSEILGLEIVLIYRWPFSVQNHFSFIRYTCSKMACGGSSYMYIESIRYLWPFGVQDHFGVIRYNDLYHKNGVEFVSLGVIVIHLYVYIKVILGVIQLSLHEKRLVVEQSEMW